MSDDYYQRQGIVHMDGTKIFATEQDKENEAQIGALVAKRWNCEVCHFGQLCVIDWYARRAGRMIGILELKNSTKPSTQYQCAWLNVRKWLALTMGSIGLGVPALFVVRWSDGMVRWQFVKDIDATHHRMGGTKYRVKSDSDIEPVIEVPIYEMRPWEENQ